MKFKVNINKQKTLANKLILPFTILIFLQSAIIIFTMIFGRSIISIKEFSITSFSNKVELREYYLQDIMQDTWANIDDETEIINKIVYEYIQKNNTNLSSVLKDHTQSSALLSNLSDELILTLRKNKTTGSFIILDSEANKKSAIYLRDNDPSVNANNNNDIIVEVAPTAARNNYQKKGLDFSSKYETSLDLNLYENPTFFNNPMSQSKNNPTISTGYLGYWTHSFTINGDKSSSSIVYSIPLRYQDGTTYGVYGITVLKSYIKKFIPISDFGDNCGNLQLVYFDGKNEYINISSNYTDSGVKDIYKMSQLNRTEFDGLYSFNTQSEKHYAVIKMLNMYTRNSPYAADHWYILGCVDETYLFGSSTSIVKQILVSAIVGFAICLFIEIILVWYVTRPISKLIDEVVGQQKNGFGKFKFDKINIYEIDALMDKIRNFVENGIERDAKISNIIKASGAPIAVYEYDRLNRNVTFTDNYYELFEIEHLRGKLDVDAFEQFRGQTREYLYQTDEEKNELFFKLPSGRHIQLKLTEYLTSEVGVLLDITDDVIKHEQIENERDIDVLTGLFNRRGLDKEIKKIWNQNIIKNAMTIMLDIDNLKYINDTYGHDFGDKYIQDTGKLLSKISFKNSIISHISGDEFVLFVYGCQDDEELNSQITIFKDAVKEFKFDLLGHKLQIKLSAGIAKYDGISNIHELIKRADFAMYELKHTKQSGVNMFNENTYINREQLIEQADKLNKLITEKLYDFAMQPIVSVKNGKLFAYEALLRSKMKEFKSPLDILDVAKKSNRLQDIEILTFFGACEKYKKFNTKIKLFINSISSQVVDIESISSFQSLYSDILDKLVIELTEVEATKEEIIKIKSDFIKNWNAQIAIDDYGTGYNNVALLVSTDPSYVKIDSSLVRDVHKLEKNRKMIQTIIEYCGSNSIEIIAEGVETKEELDTVIALGVDYVQGYYISRPSIERPVLNEVAIEQINNLIKK